MGNCFRNKYLHLKSSLKESNGLHFMELYLLVHKYKLNIPSEIYVITALT